MPNGCLLDYLHEGEGKMLREPELIDITAQVNIIENTANINIIQCFV